MRVTGLMLAAGVAAPPSMARPPAAGTDIQNIATISYVNARLGISETLSSNPVSTSVNAVSDFDIVNDQTLVRAPGDSALFAFRIVNTGNTGISVQADFGAFEGDFAFSRAIPWIDRNRNGRIDDQDVRLNGTDPIQLDLDTHVDVLVDVLTPSTVTAGMRSSGVLSASLSGGDLRRGARGEVVITEDVATLEKSASVTANVAGGEIIYTLDVRNNSDADILPAAVLNGEPLAIDGVQQTLLVVRDQIPLNTRFERVVDAVDFEPVFHLLGDPDTEWTRTQPEDVSLIDAVAFVSPDSLPPQSSRDLRFSVVIADNTAGSLIENTADFAFAGSAGVSEVASSNTVTTPIEGAPGALLIYRDPGFSDPTEQVLFDDPVYVEVLSGACNVSRDIDQALVTLTVAPGGDQETFAAVETAPNSGVFRVSNIPTAEGPPALVGDGVIQGPRNSVVTAGVDCDPSIDGDFTLSPAGVVFFSSTNEPVPGATVQLLDSAGGVLEEEVTDSSGFYSLTPTSDGVHAIRVLPPPGFTAPSTRESFLGFNRNVVARASFAEPFSVPAAGLTLDVDVPVDIETIGALSVSKTGDKQEVQLGDIVQYTIQVRNNVAIAVQETEIVDRLPAGLRFIEGSVLLDGGPMADPAFGAGRDLVFDLGVLSPNSEATVTYSARILPTAGEGDLTNLAFARGQILSLNQAVESSLASFTVEVDNSEGVFSRDGVILGKVFLDCDADGVQDGPHEVGVPGVQIVTQEGLSVITDHAGRYTLSQLAPRTHVLDVTESTLPEGASVRTTRVLDAGAGGSRFVGLQAGQIRSEDFAVVGCNADILNDVQARAERLRDHAAGRDVFFEPGSSVQFDAAAAGNQITHQSVPDTVAVLSGDDATDADAPPQGAAEPPASLSDVLDTASDEIAFVGISEGDHRVRRAASFRISAPAGLALELTRNGDPVENDRVAERVVSRTHQAVEYVAVALSTGANTFTVTGRDAFGNVRATQSVTVTAPGEPSHVEILAPAEAIADSGRPVPIRLQVVDAEGRPVSASAEVTLSAREDRFDVRDSSEQLPGLQTLIADGRADINLVPSESVGTRTISADTPFGRAEARITFKPALDTDGIAVGFAEGVIGLSGRGRGSAVGSFRGDDISPFEDTEEGAEASFFLKGRVLEDTLLTLRHDSARDVDDELFRSVEPDEFYPIYGDQSQRGFDAQSRGKTFVKVEKDSSYAVFGDVSYAARSSAFQLGTFQRTIEGAQAHTEVGRLSVDLYLGKTDTGQVVVETPALGISGPYPLAFESVIENSETVELITRDRDQPSVIIATERLGRFSAYTIDFFNQTLIFNRPIPSRDEDLNPISIRVTFETERGEGEDFWLYGGEAEFALTDWLSAGYRQLSSDGPDGSPDDRTVRAAYAAAHIGERGHLEVEAAQSITPEDESGLGVRLDYEQQTARGSFGARFASTSQDFDAPNAAVRAGRNEARLHASLRAGVGTLTSEALFTADKSSDAERYGLVGRYEAAVASHLRLRAGGRYVNDTSSVGDREDALTVIAGAGWSPQSVSGLTLDLEAEQEVTDGAQSRVAARGDYAVTPRASLYGQAEYTGSQSGNFGLTDVFNDDVTVRLGGEYRWTDRVTAFSEYRANESVFDSGVANGLTASWSVSPSLNLRARSEHVQPIGDDFQRNTAVGVGATWEPEHKDRILDADLEFASGVAGQQTWFLSTSAGQKWRSITVLARNRFARTTTLGESRERDRLRVGAAHRPEDNDRLNVLAWYEYELDDRRAFDERRHIWSVGGEWKPGALVRWRGRFAAQQFQFQNDRLNEESTTLLAQFGGDWDVHKRINTVLTTSLIGDTEYDDLIWGLGGELNVHVVDNILLGLGYNHAEVREERFDPVYRSGTYIRLRAKLDQNFWNIFD